MWGTAMVCSGSDSGQKEMGGASLLWKMPLRVGGHGCIRKTAEQVIGSKGISGVLPQPLLQFLTQGPCPTPLHDGL